MRHGPERPGARNPAKRHSYFDAGNTRAKAGCLGWKHRTRTRPVPPRDSEEHCPAKGWRTDLVRFIPIGMRNTAISVSQKQEKTLRRTNLILCKICIAPHFLLDFAHLAGIANRLPALQAPGGQVQKKQERTASKIARLPNFARRDAYGFTIV